MAELFPSDTTLNGLSGTMDAEQAVPYIPVGLSPYHVEFYKTLYRLLDVARRAGDLRVYKDDGGDLEFGVRPGRWFNGDTPVDYEGATGQDLTDNAVNYVYLTAAGVLTVNTSAFPDPSATPHIPLATVATGTQSAAGVQGQYDHADITDYRGRALLTVAAGLTPAEVAEAAAFFAATDITGTEAETLTGGSDADSLHAHGSLLSKALAQGRLLIGSAGGVATAQSLGGDASIDSAGALTITNGAVTNAKCAADMGLTRSKLAEDALARYHVTLMNCRSNVGNDISTSGSAGVFYISNGGWGTTTAVVLRGESAQGNTKTDYLCFELGIPPEYVPAGDARVIVLARLVGTGTVGAATEMNISVRKVSDSDGALGADLWSGAAGVPEKAVWNAHSFALTTTGLAAGDRLMVRLRGIVEETGGANALQLEIARIELKLDVKG